ncbi:MAG: DUF2892 domain-containing protein [Firmicutes bacterium]|nr:DUF2892 domain-containing protein [Bacillota bacterium]
MAQKSLYIQKNVGPVDQGVRIILGITLIVLPANLQWPAWTIAVLAAIGGSQIIEGITAY